MTELLADYLAIAPRSRADSLVLTALLSAEADQLAAATPRAPRWV